MVGYVFIVQFLVPITMMLINLVVSMNLFRFVYFENYQRRSGAERHVPLSADPLERTNC